MLKANRFLFFSLSLSPRTLSIVSIWRRLPWPLQSIFLLFLSLSLSSSLLLLYFTYFHFTLTFIHTHSFSLFKKEKRHFFYFFLSYSYPYPYPCPYAYAYCNYILYLLNIVDLCHNFVFPLRLSLSLFGFLNRSGIVSLKISLSLPSSSLFGFERFGICDVSIICSYRHIYTTVFIESK